MLVSWPIMRFSRSALLVLLAASGCTSVARRASLPDHGDPDVIPAACTSTFGTGSAPAAPHGPEPFVHLGPLGFRPLERAEAVLRSELVARDTASYPSGFTEHIATYRRADPLVPAMPVTVRYDEPLTPVPPFHRPLDGAVGRITYWWGFDFMHTGTPTGPLLPAEVLAGLLGRYAAIRAEVVGAYGPPSESSPLTCTPCEESGLITARRIDDWWARGPGRRQINMELSFALPCVEAPRRRAEQRMSVLLFHER
jgi:hypothetical protein